MRYPLHQRDDAEGEVNSLVFIGYLKYREGTTDDQYFINRVCCFVFYRLKDFVSKNHSWHVPRQSAKRLKLDSKNRMELKEGLLGGRLALNSVDVTDLLDVITSDNIDRDIIRLRLMGYTSHEISQRLAISNRTLYRRLIAIKEKYATQGL